MLFKETLKQQQGVVYQTLFHALKNHRLAHAYLFQGPTGTPKKQTAYLLAQSLLCEHANPYGCEECETCRRIVNEQYADLIYIDGSTSSIKKEQILQLQNNFMKTGLEEAGHKVYIINGIENATIDAINSLLKFLEEPTDDLTAILISEQMDRVLPTIVSRCQVVSFKPADQSLSLEMCRKQDMDELDAYMLCQFIQRNEEIMEAQESDTYQHARFCFKELIVKLHQNVYDALLFLQTEAFNSKNKTRDKEVLRYLLDMLIVFYKDCIKQQVVCRDSWYLQQLQAWKNDSQAIYQYLEILMDTKDTLVRSSVNIALLIDQLLYRIKEVTRNE